MHFGASLGDARYEAKYDLDQDGTIGFGDFLIFGQEFGTSRRIRGQMALGLFECRNFVPADVIRGRHRGLRAEPHAFLWKLWEARRLQHCHFIFKKRVDLWIALVSFFGAGSQTGRKPRTLRCSIMRHRRFDAQLYGIPFIRCRVGGRLITT